MTGNISSHKTLRKKRYGVDALNLRSYGQKKETYHVVKKSLAQQGQARYSEVTHPPTVLHVSALTSYNNAEIFCFLKEKKIFQFGCSAFDACIFQSVLFVESWIEHPKTRAYLHKKLSEFLEGVRTECQNALEAYNKIEKKSIYVNFCKDIASNFIDIASLLTTFEVFLKKNLINLDIFSDSMREDFSLTQEKLCLLFVIQASARDVAHRMNHFVTAFRELSTTSSSFWPISKGVFWERRADDCGVLYRVIAAMEDQSLSFNCPDVTPRERTLIEQIAQVIPSISYLENSSYLQKFLPCFSQSGGLGINAILYGILCGQKLPLAGILGDANACYKAHNGFFYGEEAPRLGMFIHDVAHLDLTWNNFDNASFFREIYLHVNDPHSDYTVAQRKADLFVIFLFVHEFPHIPFYMQYKIKERTEDIYQVYQNFEENFGDHLFDYIEKFFQDDHDPKTELILTPDLLPVLKAILAEDPIFSDLDLKFFSLKKDEKELGHLRVFCENLDLYEEEIYENQEDLRSLLFKEMAKAMEALWIAFRQRHKDLLAKEGVTPEKIPFLFSDSV